MPNSFQSAAGTTAGAHHRRGILRNNQSFALVHTTDSLTSAVIADGNSSVPQSYVASALQADWFAQLTHEHAASGKPFDEDAWSAIAEQIAERILHNAQWSRLSVEEAIHKMWVSTVGGILVGEEFTHVAFFGDGRYYLNGELFVLDAETRIGEHLVPACPCYLVSATDIPLKHLRFRAFTFHTADVQHAAVIDDGLDYWIDSARRKMKIPGGNGDPVPDPSVLWTLDELYADPTALNRLLNYIGRDWRNKGGMNLVVGGRLFDDVAAAVVRRKPTEA